MVAALCGAAVLATLAACGSDSTTAPPGLATITVTPDTVTLAPGTTQQFTAVGKDGNGNNVTIDPTWGIESGSGSMSGAGLFTAGDGPDTVTVTAKSGSVTGRSTVIVTAGTSVVGDYALQSVDGKAPPDTVVNTGTAIVVFTDGILSLHSDATYKLLFHSTTTTSSGTTPDSSGSTGTYTVNGNTVEIHNSAGGAAVVATVSQPTISFTDGNLDFVFTKQ
jgi:hypothetical protein